MQRSFVELLCCPVCSAAVTLRGWESAREIVTEGVLTCVRCRVWYPVTRGVPVMFAYPTPAASRFAERWRDELAAAFPGFGFPSGQPSPGERWVQRAFSREWGEFAYDGGLFSYTHEERCAMLRADVGPLRPDHRYGWFVDVGCGIGVTTEMAARQFGMAAVGIDLSNAVFEAVARFGKAPGLHFVQGSVSQLPLRRCAFDLVYSSGALHHTYDTSTALAQVAELCRPGGRLAVWLYGVEAARRTLRRRVIQGLERMLAPILSRLPSRVADVVCVPLALVVLTHRRVSPTRNSGSARYTFQRSLHAVRDQFTIAYSHRHTVTEVMSWFARAGFESLHEVPLDAYPESIRWNMWGNVSVYGDRTTARVAEAAPPGTRTLS